MGWRSTQFTWLLTEGNLPPSALVPFCSYQGESNHLGRDIVTEMDNMTVCDKFQPTKFQVSCVTRLTLLSLESVQQNQANRMVFAFCWTQTLISRILLTTKLESKVSRCSSILLPNTPHLDLGCMGWAIWKRWLGQKISNSFLTIRRNAAFRAGKSVSH